ncbi:MAG: hypothetical protein ACLR6J_18925 [Parabacteroides merdae]
MKKNWGGSSGTNIFRNVCRCISEVAVICCVINDFNGAILHSQIKEYLCCERDERDLVLLRIGAAEKWDDVVAYAVSKGWGG